MKNYFKKSVSVFLAFMMIFGAMAGIVGGSLISLDAQAETANVLTLETKLYRYDSVAEDWVYTDRVMPGEDIKARLFIDTSYYAAAGEIIVFLNNEMFEDDYSFDTRYDLRVNPAEDSSAAINGVTGVFRKMASDDLVISQLVEDGYLPYDFALQHTSYAMVYHLDMNTCKKISGDDWFAEFDIRVKNTAHDTDGMLIIPSTIMNPNDGVDAYINIPVGTENGHVGESVAMFIAEVETNVINNLVSTRSTITFDAYGGYFENMTDICEIEQIIGSDFDIPIPEKDGFVFEGWANEYGEIVALPLQMPLYDMNFKAVWNKAEPEMYMVNFNFMGDVPEGYEIPGSFICEAGLVVNCPEIPFVEGYTFDGWYYNDKICESFIMPSNDVVLRGVWTANEFKIILDAEEGEFIDGSHQFTEKVPCGYSLSSVIPPEPTREGFEFMGWVDENGLMADMPSYMPEHDLILTAVWKTNVHTVYIDVDGDITEYARFAYGDEIDLPPTPEKDGYMFAGWRVIDINGDEAFVPTVMPDCDLTFIAQWEEIIPDTHTVSYYLAAGGELYRTEVYEEGETINYYMPSSVEGLVFRGWVDENGDELPAMMGTDDIVAYAVFEPAKYTVTFIIGKETVSETFNYGSPVNVPEISSEYVIAKWVDENGDEVKFPINTLNRDMTVTAECRYVAKVEELDISVEYGDGCFDEDVKLVIDDLTDDKINGNQSTTGNINYHEVKENGKTARPVGFYNIKMVKSDGKTAQPNKNTFVTVTMKIPDGYTGKTEFKLYHWYTTGGYEIISTSSSERKITRNGDYLIFDIYSFSNFELFVIIDESASVSKLPKTNYNYKGGSIDLSGIELKIPNGDGTYETVTDTSKMTVSGFDSSKVGDQTVRVEYQGTSAEYKVSVSYTWWQWIIRILLLGFIWY